MKSIFSSLLLCLIAAASLNAQSITDGQGKTLKQQVYTASEGSYLLNNNWLKGSITTTKNEVFTGLDLKFDIKANVLLYKDANGQTMELAEAIASFKITDAGSERLFQSGYQPIDANTTKTFYEVMAAGNGIQFLKQTVKVVFTEKDYSGVATDKIQDKVTYYIAKNNLPIKVSRDTKSILAAIGSNEAALKTFIAENKLNLRQDSDLKLLFNYLGSNNKS